MKLAIEERDRAFLAIGNIATAGGCLSSQYLAAWIIYRSLGREAVEDVFNSVAPVGEEQSFIERVLSAMND